MAHSDSTGTVGLVVIVPFVEVDCRSSRQHGLLMGQCLTECLYIKCTACYFLL